MTEGPADEKETIYFNTIDSERWKKAIDFKNRF